MATKQAMIHVMRWKGNQHPTMTHIINDMKSKGLRPYMWFNSANHRYAVRSHNYDKVLYVLDGTLEVLLPDTNQRVILKSGDRIDIPAGVRHGTIVGSNGAKCVEASINRRRSRRAN